MGGGQVALPDRRQARAAAELSPAERAINSLDPNPPQILFDIGAAVAEAVAGLSPAELALNDLDTAVADSRTADDARGPNSTPATVAAARGQPQQLHRRAYPVLA